MIGLGEEKSEIVELLQHAAEAGVDILTIGQYLRPSVKHAEIKKYYHPDEFAELGEMGRSLGIRWVFPVRSSEAPTTPKTSSIRWSRWATRVSPAVRP